MNEINFRTHNQIKCPISRVQCTVNGNGPLLVILFTTSIQCSFMSPKKILSAARNVQDMSVKYQFNNNFNSHKIRKMK